MYVLLEGRGVVVHLVRRAPIITVCLMSSFRGYYAEDGRDALKASPHSAEKAPIYYAVGTKKNGAVTTKNKRRNGIYAERNFFPEM